MGTTVGRLGAARSQLKFTRASKFGAVQIRSSGRQNSAFAETGSCSLVEIRVSVTQRASSMAPWSATAGIAEMLETSPLSTD